MSHPMPYEVVLERHPELVAEVTAQLRRGKSVHREAPPEALSWGYFYTVRFRSYSLREVLWGITRDEPPEDPLEERVLVSVEARIGRWRGVSRGLVLPLPPEIRELLQLPPAE